MPGGALHGEASPVFRLTSYFPYYEAHPYLMPDAWQALLDCFLPLVREHCDRIILWNRPGAKARRGKRIFEADWRPFHHLSSLQNDVESGIFTGFSFNGGAIFDETRKTRPGLAPWTHVKGGF